MAANKRQSPGSRNYWRLIFGDSVRYCFFGKSPSFLATPCAARVVSLHRTPHKNNVRHRPHLPDCGPRGPPPVGRGDQCCACTLARELMGFLVHCFFFYGERFLQSWHRWKKFFFIFLLRSRSLTPHPSRLLHDVTCAGFVARAG